MGFTLMGPLFGDRRGHTEAEMDPGLSLDIICTYSELPFGVHRRHAARFFPYRNEGQSPATFTGVGCTARPLRFYTKSSLNLCRNIGHKRAKANF